jgi:predicted RNase H-like HicB family nuclease
MLKIAVVLETCEEGGFSASVPTIPGCFGEGESIEEALRNISRAIELHLEATEDDLLVEEGAIIRELSWELSPPVRSAYEPRPSTSPLLA